MRWTTQKHSWNMWEHGHKDNNFVFITVSNIGICAYLNQLLMLHTEKQVYDNASGSERLHVP